MRHSLVDDHSSFMKKSAKQRLNLSQVQFVHQTPSFTKIVSHPYANAFAPYPIRPTTQKSKSVAQIYRSRKITYDRYVNEYRPIISFVTPSKQDIFQQKRPSFAVDVNPYDNVYRRVLESKEKQKNRLQIKGRVHKGYSWRAEDKISSIPENTRYIRRSQTPIETRELSSKKKEVFDMSNINKHFQSKKECFEYVMRVSHRTKKGFLPNDYEKVNQDSFIIASNMHNKTHIHYFGVCDGHGSNGHLVSQFIKATLPSELLNFKTLEKHPREGLLHAFQATSMKLRSSKIDINFSGSTVIGCYLNQNKLYCANVGDSRAIVGRRNREWKVECVSEDHKPYLAKEAERIKRMKGRIEAFKNEYGQSVGPLRVWVQKEQVPGLAMSRSFGDLVAASVGVIAIPEIKELTLTEQDRILLIGSDGLFEFLTNEKILLELAPFYQKKQLQQASDHLLQLAYNSWTRNSSIVDDITFILIFIHYKDLV